MLVTIVKFSHSVLEAAGSFFGLRGTSLESLLFIDRQLDTGDPAFCLCNKQDYFSSY